MKFQFKIQDHILYMEEWSAVQPYVSIAYLP